MYAALLLRITKFQSHENTFLQLGLNVHILMNLLSEVAKTKSPTFSYWRTVELDGDRRGT